MATVASTSVSSARQPLPSHPGALPTGRFAPPSPNVDGDLDVPTTVAFVAGSLWAANARFSTTPEPDTPYWITRIPLH
jgi:hypothetical protein